AAKEDRKIPHPAGRTHPRARRAGAVAGGPAARRGGQYEVGPRRAHAPLSRHSGRYAPHSAIGSRPRPAGGPRTGKVPDRGRSHTGGVTQPRPILGGFRQIGFVFGRGQRHPQFHRHKETRLALVSGHFLVKLLILNKILALFLRNLPLFLASPSPRSEEHTSE